MSASHVNREGGSVRCLFFCKNLASGIEHTIPSFSSNSFAYGALNLARHIVRCPRGLLPAIASLYPIFDADRHWPTLPNPGRPADSTLSDAGRAWSTLVDPGQSWSTLVDPARSWSTVIDSGPTLVDPGRPWQILVDHGRPWSILVALS